MLKRIKDSIFDILRQADWLLLCLCCGAALFGLVMIASATNFLNSWKMVIVQACAIVLGVGIYFLMSQIDLTEAAKRWKWLLGFGIVMFLLLKTPLGIENNGNRAWLGIQGFPANIQPAEIVKLTFILVLSRQLVWVKENWGLKSLRSIAFLAGHVLLMVGLYYVISSDMGSALVYIFIFAAMAFVAGVAARWFIIALLGGGAAFYLLWELDKIPDYMKERFMVVFDHNLDPLGAGWQQTRSLLALGGGKLTGQGLFHGIQTQGEYSGSLPFRYTDFIFSAIGEELGMLGCLAVLLLLAAIIVLAIMILPTVINISETSIRAVPAGIKSSSLALGASHAQTIFRSILPAAKSGIVTAIVLGVGRAIGEAMAITLVSGSSVNVPLPFNSVRFLTTAIVSEMGYSSGLHRQVLFTIGLVLFVFIMIINIVLNKILKKGADDNE